MDFEAEENMSYTIIYGGSTFTMNDPVTVARIGAKHIAATKMRSGALKIDDHGISNDGIVIYGVYRSSDVYTKFATLDGMTGKLITLAGMNDTNFNGLYRLESHSCKAEQGKQNHYNYQIHLEKI